MACERETVWVCLRPAQHLLFACHWISGPSVPQSWECMALCLRAWILIPTHQVMSQKICIPREGPGGRACAYPGWGIRLCLLGSADLGAPEIPGPQPRELPTPQHPIRFTGNLCFRSSKSSDINTQMELKYTFLFKKVRDNSVKSTNAHFLITSLL